MRIAVQIHFNRVREMAAGYVHEQFGLPLPGFLHIDCLDCYAGAEEGESEEAFSQRLLATLEQRIESEDPDTIAGARVADRAESCGLFVRAIGDVIAISPPPPISKAEMCQFIERLALAIVDVEAGL